VPRADIDWLSVAQTDENLAAHNFPERPTVSSKLIEGFQEINAKRKGGAMKGLGLPPPVGKPSTAPEWPKGFVVHLWVVLC